MSRPASVTDPDDAGERKGGPQGDRRGDHHAVPGPLPEVVADARVIRRGKSLCFCDVDVTDADGGLVAKAIVTYKLG